MQASCATGTTVGMLMSFPYYSHLISSVAASLREQARLLSPFTHDRLDSGQGVNVVRLGSPRHLECATLHIPAEPPSGEPPSPDPGPSSPSVARVPEGLRVAVGWIRSKLTYGWSIADHTVGNVIQG